MNGMGSGANAPPQLDDGNQLASTGRPWSMRYITRTGSLPHWTKDSGTIATSVFRSWQRSSNPLRSVLPGINAVIIGLSSNGDFLSEMLHSFFGPVSADFGPAETARAASPS